MLKKIFKCKFHLRFVFNPLIRYLADNMGGYQGVNLLKREVPIIVSLTSYEERFSDFSSRDGKFNRERNGRKAPRFSKEKAQVRGRVWGPEGIKDL